MGSTKKVTKKLAGADAGTALWMSSVGNELGQVLMSVLTAAEGYGLRDMARGLQERYQLAGKEPPQVLYVDRDCCRRDGETCAAAALFPAWPHLAVRLDTWHFIRRLAAGVTSESHPLYPEFMRRISGCIFEWDPEDLSLLETALQADGSRRTPSTKEMGRHCRRRTRGAQETERLLGETVEAFKGATDTMNVPLLDRRRMEEILETQRHHIPCIQDPAGVPLYTKTGQLTRGGVSLPVYRCARGSTSLHSFHLHLHRFIPGSSARGTFFQMFLLEGLTRWNEDRGKAAAGAEGAGTSCYSGQEQHTLHQLTQQFFQTTLVESYVKPLQYTDELIGISYLYNQTGKVLQPLPEDPDEPDDSTEVTVEEEEEEEDVDEGYDHDTEDLFHLPSPPPPHPHPPAPAPHPPAPAPPPHPPAPPPHPPAPAPPPPHPPAPAPPPHPPAPPPPPPSPPPAPSPHPPAPPPPPPAPPPHPPAPRSAPQLLQHHPPAPSPHPPAPAPSPHPPAPPPPPPAPRSIPQLLQHHPPPPPGPSHQATAGTVAAPGHQQVRRLAQGLVELCGKGDVTQEEVEVLVGLWENLLDVDKGRVVYPPRYRAQLTQGGSKTSTANTEAAPGLESMKRCMVGTGRAMWPNTSRLVEAIFILLCQLNPSSRTKWGFLRSRWTLVIQEYDQIRAAFSRSPALVARTTLQLFGVNQKTLSQWHKRWTSAQENILLTSGIHALQAPRAAEEALLPERAMKEEEPQAEEPHAEEPHAEEPHAEEALAGPSWSFPATSSSSSSPVPFPSSSSTPSPSPSSSSTPSPSPSSSSYTPKSTTYNRLRLQEKQAEAARRGESLSLRAPSQAKCSSCGLRKIKETGHRLLVKPSGERVSYCPAPAGGKSPEEWLASLQ